MTCVLGIRFENGVLLAGDSVGVVPGWGIAQMRRDPKAYSLNRRVAIAYTSSFRMGQILRYNLDVPPVVDPAGDPIEDLFKWAVESFVPAVREALKENGYTKIENSQEEGGTFLLAVRDRLFEVGDDFQVGEPVLAYAAAGSGGDIAHGALHAQIGRAERVEKNGDKTPEARARKIAMKALDAAVEHNAYVRPPYTFVVTS